VKLLGLKIFIIEDDAFYAALLKKFLEKNNFSDIVLFESPIDCFKEVGSNPDVIFMDYHLGDVDGIKTARILKRNWPKTYIILMSTSVKKTSVYGRYPNLINSYILKNPDFNGISKKMHFLKWMKFLRFSLKILAFIGMIFALFYFLL
jgi:DNA-binding response OmpR family regulator